MTALDWQVLADAICDHDSDAAAPLLATWQAEGGSIVDGEPYSYPI